jgi:uncharacterized membrane protein YhdT
MMKYTAIVISALWFIGWFLAGYLTSGVVGLIGFMTLIFPSFCLGYILCWEIEKVRK